MKKLEKVSQIINCLTNNDDLRQELWLHYLDGNSLESFSSHLKKISQDHESDAKFRLNAWQLIKEQPSESFFNAVESFTDLERSVMCLLMLGLSTEQISNYHGISEVRIKQLIATIRYNPIWDSYHGTKEKP